jgi:membrane protein DedA with SNARE-associated domain
MPFSGYLVLTGRFSLLLVATAGAMGCNLGSTLAYAVGYFGGRAQVERWGKYVFLSKRELKLVDGFFERHGAITVFICRLLPVVRTYIALPAGIARMNQVKFQAYTFIGSWIWCYALAWLGIKLGEKWNSTPWVKQVFHSLDAIMIVAILAGLGVFIRWHLRQSRSRKK